MKALKKIWEAIATPIIALAVHIGTSREINEDGSWDKYNAKRNRRTSI
jgi:hypothetical protein